MAVVEPGGKAPAFSLPDQEGTVHRLRDYAARPKDDTPGCTREACAFRDALPDFTAARTWAWPV
jgi:peroxiredoxin Q/BCP